MEGCQLTAYGNLVAFSKSFQTSTKGYIRNVYLDTLIVTIESDFGDLYSNIDDARSVLQELSQPNQPFSSYVAAYARSLGIQVR